MNSQSLPVPSGSAQTAPLREPSPAYLAYLQRERRRARLIMSSRIVLLAAFLLIWEVAARTHLVNPMLTSYPSAIWPTFLDLLNQGDLITHTMATFKATIVGFCTSMVVGIAVAAVLWWSDFTYKVLDPFLVIVNAMPKIAFVPIFYIWLGAEYSIYGMAVAISVFITIMVVYEGFRGIDPNKVKLAYTLGANRWQILRMVILPGSVPTLLAALKMNIGLALVGVIVGEFQSSDEGLGFLIINGSQIFKLNIVMTSIVVLTLLAGVMYFAVARLEAAIGRRYR